MPARWLVAALVVVGFGITLLVFYPGIMTFDARYMLEDAAKGFRGDWQSPAMVSLWALINPLAPGPASMFLLISASYWFAFGLLASAIARQSLRLAILLLMLAACPPAFLFVGIIWRDVLFAAGWLLAAALCLTTATTRLRLPAQIIALGLLAFGVLLRPNALIAAPVLATYIMWPQQFRWQRLAILFVPVALACYALVQVVYYDAIGALRQHPEQSLMIFDLGGISHFAKQNQFPTTWGTDEERQIVDTCYHPTEWDQYWRLKPCDFVMNRIEKEQHLFGKPAIPEAWLRAIARHPLAYLEHRAAFLWNFLAGDNLTLWTYDVEAAPTLPLKERPSMRVLIAIDQALKFTPLLRVGSWLLLCLAGCAIAWRRRDTPGGSFALGVSGAGALYTLSFFTLGVASDFRYGYWAVLAGTAGAVVLAADGVRRPRP
jgi:hypothetical protein